MGDRIDAAPVVLNVDDYPSTRYMRTRILRGAGFNVVEAATGQEALKAASTTRPGVILLDVHLPDMSGFEVCQRLKADPSTAAIPVVHLSASFITPADRAAGLEGGADGYLVEPVEHLVLLATVNAFLRARRAEAERERLLEEATAARAAAEEANRAKDEMLAVLSHEMRGTLNTIVGWLAMLRRAQPDTAAYERAVETIARAARQQAHLVEDLLDYAGAIAGRMRIDLRPMDLGQVIEGAVAAIGPQTQAARLALDVEVDEKARAVTGDDLRLQQVVHNLLSNAVKFTPRGGRISVRLARDDGRAVLTVADTGRGIDRAFLPHVFDRYRQEPEPPATGRRGVGLGLAIVRHIVERHGGTIEAASDGPGRGATFTMTLPLRDASAYEPARASR